MITVAVKNEGYDTFVRAAAAACLQVSRQPRDFHGTADPGPADDPAERERGGVVL